MMMTQTGLLEQSYRLQIAGFANQPCCMENYLVQHMSKELTAGRFDYTYALMRDIHAIMFCMVLTAIIFDQQLIAINNSEDQDDN